VMRAADRHKLEPIGFQPLDDIAAGGGFGAAPASDEMAILFI
jgi:hypothetical protein